MSKRKESSASSPRSRCFANFRMTPEEFGVWDRLRSVSHALGTIYFDGRAIAGYFAHTGKDVIYRIVKSLVRKDWLLAEATGQRGGNGVFIPSQYQVLSHEEWADANPNEFQIDSP